jgi:hypothetical protein
MKRVQIVAVIALLALGLGLGSRAWPQKAPAGTGDRERERRSFAINLVRAIQKAQLDFKSKHAIYANWDSLYGNGYFTSTGTKWASPEFPTVGQALYGNGPEVVPGWRLRLNVSHSGSAYDLLLEDVNDPKCGYAVVADERGTVRHSKSVECPIQ